MLNDKQPEPESRHDDGTLRKAHYGAGVQPWDIMVELGIALPFAAANVIKYVKRAPMKNGQDDMRKARWYWDRLVTMNKQLDMKEQIKLTEKVVSVLTVEEKAALHATPSE